MPSPRPLSRDPIQEAIVDFRAVETAIGEAEDLAPIASQLSAEFPQREERRRFEAQLAVRDGRFVSDSQDKGFFGLFLKSADGLKIAQFRMDGFTFNRLKPYSGWHSIRPEALKLWDRYVDFAKPKHVSRIALRYINRLDIPLAQGRDFGLYLRSAPEIPPELPQGVNGFHTLVTIESDGMLANINQRLDESNEHTMVVILDLDVYMMGEMSIDPGSVSEILDRLHDFKNRLFFELLTETTLGFYE
jgi:uncharacterized protein (TIGR04255 family)